MITSQTLPKFLSYTTIAFPMYSAFVAFLRVRRINIVRSTEEQVVETCFIETMLFHQIQR